MRFSPFAALCATGFFAIFSSTISKSPVLPLFASSLGADPAGVGAVASVSAFTGIVASIPAGILADRIGKRRMLLISLLIFSTAPFLYLMVRELWHLALVRFYHGFATAIFVPVAMASVAGLYQGERGEKIGWFSTATLLGRFLAPLAGGGIIAFFMTAFGSGVQAVYLVCASAGLIGLLLFWRVRSDESTKAPKAGWSESFASFREIVSDRRILITAAVEAAILFAYGTFETFLPLAAVAANLSPAEVGIFLSSQVITLALTKPFMGRLSDRRGRRPQILWGALVSAVAVAGFAAARSFFPLLLLSIVFGLGLSVVTSATAALIADMSRSRAHGAAMGILGSVMDIGHTAGPLVSGMLARSFGFGAAFAMAGILLIATAGLFRAALSRE